MPARKPLNVPLPLQWWGARLSREAPAPPEGERPEEAAAGPSYVLSYDPEEGEGFEAEERTVQLLSQREGLFADCWHLGVAPVCRVSKPEALNQRGSCSSVNMMIHQVDRVLERVHSIVSVTMQFSHHN